MPWRVYRPAIVVGHSETGAMDKIDGPYYFFPLLKRMRDTLPGWMPLVGVDLGDTNVVPVDYVAKAMDHIAHQPDLDGQAFHLVNPEPQSTVDLVNTFAAAAKAPQFAVPVDRSVTGRLPTALLPRGAAPGRPARRRPAAAAGAPGAEPDHRPARHPAGGARARLVPDGLRLAVHREGAGRVRHLRARPRVLRRDAVDLLGGDARRLHQARRLGRQGAEPARPS